MKRNLSPEPTLLGFLLAGPLHGYDLYKEVSAQLGTVWQLGQSQMYAILNDYATRGWIETRVQTQGLRPAKKVLALTPAGRKAFKAWLAQPAHGLREFRVDFFLRLYFARAAGSSPAGRLIDEQISASRRELESLEAFCAEADGDPQAFSNQVRRFRIAQLTTIIQWLEDNRAELAPVHKPKRANSHPAPTAKKRAGKGTHT